MIRMRAHGEVGEGAPILAVSVEVISRSLEALRDLAEVQGSPVTLRGVQSRVTVKKRYSSSKYKSRAKKYSKKKIL